MALYTLDILAHKCIKNIYFGQFCSIDAYLKIFWNGTWRKKYLLSKCIFIKILCAKISCVEALRRFTFYNQNFCFENYARDLLKSHVNREHRNKSSSEKDKRDQKRREEKAKDEKRREKDRQKDKESKKDKDKSRHKSSDKSYKRGETESGIK